MSLGQREDSSLNYSLLVMEDAKFEVTFIVEL
jgi:hypothetical protein